MPRKLNAIALTTIMVASLFAGGTVADVGIGQQTESTAPTEITACTVIDSPGHYALTQDIVKQAGSDDPCIEIQASDVTLEGNGYVIDEDSSQGPGVATTEANPVENVTIEDLTVRGYERGFRFTNLTNARLTNVSTVSPGIIGMHIEQSQDIDIQDSDLEGGISRAVRVDDSENLTVVNNTLTSHTAFYASGMDRSEIRDNVLQASGTGVSLGSGSENVISNNTISGRIETGISVSGRNNTVASNEIGLGHNGITISGSNHTVASNHVEGTDGWAAIARGTNHTFRNNSLSGGEGEGMSGGALQIRGADHEITNNSLRGVHGTYVTSATGPISIRHNRYHAVYQVRVGESSLCPDPGQVIEVHWNIFESDNYVGNQPYAVLNENDDMVNATNNYWDASDGPSSPDGETVTDPVTGTVANGSGMPVSEGVHFDPHLEEPPANETDS